MGACQALPRHCCETLTNPVARLILLYYTPYGVVYALCTFKCMNSIPERPQDNRLLRLNASVPFSGQITQVLSLLSIHELLLPRCYQYSLPKLPPIRCMYCL